MDELVNQIRGMVTIPNKIDPCIFILIVSWILAPFYFIYDHCFQLAGKGCVMTGTVLSGSVCVNDEIEFPSLHITRKVKSIQMFHKGIEKVLKGDRAGICVQ